MMLLGAANHYHKLVVSPTTIVVRSEIPDFSEIFMNDYYKGWAYFILIPKVSLISCFIIVIFKNVFLKNTGKHFLALSEILLVGGNSETIDFGIFPESLKHALASGIGHSEISNQSPSPLRRCLYPSGNDSELLDNFYHAPGSGQPLSQISG